MEGDGVAGPAVWRWTDVCWAGWRGACTEAASRRCAFRPRGTRNKDGRKITRWVDEHRLEEMAAHLRRDPTLFGQRKVLAEHPYGTMKRGKDQGYVLLRGLRKVRGEFSLTALAYNLKRVINLVGVPQLLAALA